MRLDMVDLASDSTASIFMADPTRYLRRHRLGMQDRIRMVFASAPSQIEFLDHLGGESGIDWTRVETFLLDEYIGIPAIDMRSFGLFLPERLFDRTRPGGVCLMDGMAKPEAECRRYAALMERAPLDVCCVGIGENGDLAFKDPPVADLGDPHLVKVVEPDEGSRRQQVGEKSPESPDRMPRTTFTMTLPAILSARFIFCMVPGASKAVAVKGTLEDPVSTACPAAALRTYAAARSFLDEDSCRLMDTAIVKG